MSNAPLKTMALLSTVALLACGYQEVTTEVGYDELAEAQDELALTRGRFEIFVGRDGRYYFQLLAGNGEKVLASQGYTTRASAESGIESVKANGVDASRYALNEAQNGEWYFTLVAANGRVIGVSETYTSKYDAERAVATVVRIVKATAALSQPPAATSRFEVFRGLDKQYYFHLRARNGEIVLQSEGYVSRSGAENGVASVQANGGAAGAYELREASDGRWYFVLKAANRQVIGRGQMYASKSAAEGGIAACVELLAPPTR